MVSSVLLLALLILPTTLFADETDTSAAASSIWLILAGEGTWGAVLVAVVGVLWKVAKPYLDEWAGASWKNSSSPLKPASAAARRCTPMR
ncbi:MAG: hypothetical protein LIP77_09745 [Planctomycetes bacterium]|nr:hypothetical protein [Planctomycetota bacterium]